MIKKVMVLIAGLFLYAVGVVLTIHAGLGLAPWDIFHQGLSLHFPLTMGQASITASCIILIIDFALKEKIGLGTVLNVILIGAFMDMLMIFHLIPVFEQPIMQLLMLITGMVTIGFASYVYIRPGLGTGPRDGLMVALCKKTGKSVRAVRAGIDITVSAVGFLLGGSLGLGTVIMAVCLGPVMQWIFRRLHFDVKAVKHSYIDEEIRHFFRKTGKEAQQREEVENE